LRKAAADFFHRGLHTRALATAENAGAVGEAAEPHILFAETLVSVAQRESAVRTGRRSSVDSLDTSGTLHG